MTLSLSLSPPLTLSLSLSVSLEVSPEGRERRLRREPDPSIRGLDRHEHLGVERAGGGVGVAKNLKEGDARGRAAAASPFLAVAVAAPELVLERLPPLRPLGLGLFGERREEEGQGRLELRGPLLVEGQGESRGPDVELEGFD